MEPQLIWFNFSDPENSPFAVRAKDGSFHPFVIGIQNGPLANPERVYSGEFEGVYIHKLWQTIPIKIEKIVNPTEQQLWEFLHEWQVDQVRIHQQQPNIIFGRIHAVLIGINSISFSLISQETAEKAQADLR